MEPGAGDSPLSCPTRGRRVAALRDCCFLQRYQPSYLCVGKPDHNQGFTRLILVFM